MINRQSWTVNNSSRKMSSDHQEEQTINREVLSFNYDENLDNIETHSNHDESQRVSLLRGQRVSELFDTCLIQNDLHRASRGSFSNAMPVNTIYQLSEATVVYDPHGRVSAEQLQVANDSLMTNMAALTQSYGKFTSSSSSKHGNEDDIDKDLDLMSTTDSTVRVEIADYDADSSINVTTNALKKCKKEVLRPYWRLLSFIGWRRFGQESVNSGSCGWQILNGFYTTCIIILLLYTYIYSMVACQWKLDIDEDTHKVVRTTAKRHMTTSPPFNKTFVDKFPSAFFTSRNINTPASPPAKNSSYSNLACKHIVSTYGISSTLHFIAYLLGLYYFRHQENEQLYALMEKGFLQASPLHTMSASQQKVIFRLRLYLVLSALWILSTIGESLLFQWAYEFSRLELLQAMGKPLRITLLCIQILGFTVLNSVIVAVVMNYITQCEMIIFYIKGIVQRFQERASDLRIAMKDIFILRQSISALNGPMSKMMTLIALFSGGSTIVGTVILSLNKDNEVLVWVYRAVFWLNYTIILCIPLIQAARTNSIGRRILKLALEARVFGYKMASQIELDSFLLFVSNTKLQVRIFHIPITTTHLVASAILISYTIIILFQTNVIGTSI